MTDNSYLMQYFLEHSPKEKEPKTKSVPQKPIPDKKSGEEQEK